MHEPIESRFAAAAAAGKRPRRRLTHHDNEYIPDEEFRPARRLGGRREARVLVFGILVGLLASLGPNVDVFVQLPFLFVDERVDVQCTPFARILDELDLVLVTIGRQRYRQILNETSHTRTHMYYTPGANVQNRARHWRNACVIR